MNDKACWSSPGRWRKRNASSRNDTSHSQVARRDRGRHAGVSLCTAGVRSAPSCHWRRAAIRACSGEGWRATADEDGHYSFAVSYDAAVRHALQTASLQ
jgi:hypothetical protein